MVAKGSQEEAYLRRQVADSVRGAISELTPKLRLPILLKYVEGLSYDEIASRSASPSARYPRGSIGDTRCWLASWVICVASSYQGNKRC